MSLIQVALETRKLFPERDNGHGICLAFYTLCLGKGMYLASEAWKIVWALKKLQTLLQTVLPDHKRKEPRKQHPEDCPGLVYFASHNYFPDLEILMPQLIGNLGTENHTFKFLYFPNKQ